MKDLNKRWKRLVDAYENDLFPAEELASRITRNRAQTETLERQLALSRAAASAEGDLEGELRTRENLLAVRQLLGAPSDDPRATSQLQRALREAKVELVFTLADPPTASIRSFE